METVVVLRESARLFCPDLQPVIDSNCDSAASTWNASVETGKAVELATLCGLISSIRKLKYQVKIPDLYFERPELFYLRNVIPRHHGAQPGHLGATVNAIPLEDRFAAAMTPKCEIVGDDGRHLEVYREGHPFHSIGAAVREHDYRDRPDIVISSVDVNTIVSGSSELKFEYSQGDNVLKGSLAIRNDINLPLKSLTTDGNGLVSFCGLIECSAAKTVKHANTQLATYRKTFGLDPKTATLLVNGSPVSTSDYDRSIHLMAVDVEPEKLCVDFGGQILEFAEMLF
jgi:hypothetical protein